MALPRAVPGVKCAVGVNGDGAIGLDGPLPRLGTGAGPVLKLEYVGKKHTSSEPTSQEERMANTISNPVGPIACSRQGIDCDVGRITGFLVDGDAADGDGLREPIRDCATQCTTHTERERGERVWGGGRKGGEGEGEGVGGGVEGRGRGRGGGAEGKGGGRGSEREGQAYGRRTGEPCIAPGSPWGPARASSW